MIKKASLDTNALLRWALQDIPEQAGKVDTLLHQNVSLEVADVAVIEMVFVLEKVYQLPRSLIAEHVELLMSTSQINCNRTLFSEVLPLYRQHVSLSVIDCSLACYAKLNQAEPLYTFDQALAKQLPQAKLL